MPYEKEPRFYEYEELPGEQEIERQRLDEIANAPSEPNELREEIEENYAASPADSGGDVDADWEEVNTSGSESVFGHNPTPDQSNAEANAHAMGIDFADTEPLDFVKKIEDRDKDRFELNEDSRTAEGTI